MNSKKQVGLYIEITDRLKNRITESGLNFETYRTLLKICAKGAQSSISYDKDQNIVISIDHCVRSIEDCYINLYNQMTRDLKYVSLETMINELAENLIRFDLFFYLFEVEDQYRLFLISDAYPKTKKNIIQSKRAYFIDKNFIIH